jgi:hypothetical protein
MDKFRFLRPFIFIYGCLLLLLAGCSPGAGTAVSNRRAETTPATFAPADATSTAAATVALTPRVQPPEIGTTIRPTPTDSPLPTRIFIPPTSLWLSAVTAVDIFSGPGETYNQVGVLEMGAAAKTLGGTQDDWFPVECPEGVDGRCWVFWDYNALYSYDAIEPLTLTIPEPESLIVETIDMVDSPDGRWQAEITRSETAWLAGESAGFFYTQLTISSLEDERTWPLVGEWHAAGLGEEGQGDMYHRLAVERFTC